MQMAPFGRVCAALVAIGWAAAGSAMEPQGAGAGYKKAPGPYEVEAVRYDWVDGQRKRDVPVKLYFPRSGDGPFPAIIFSHGLGGSREGYEYLGRHWAGHGYVSVHVQHQGSDNEVWQGKEQVLSALNAAAADPRNAISRPLDIRFAIDQLEKLNREEGPLKGRLELGKIGAAGHSFGAYTALAVAGQIFAGARGRAAALPDRRVKAAIAMSAPVQPDRGQYDQAYGGIAIPCFHLTGTLDRSPIGNTRPEDRRVPFDRIRGADQYLVTFAGGDHLIFSGRARPAGGGVFRGPKGGKDALFQELIRQSSTAFWDAYLEGDLKAKAWLAEGGFEAVLGKDGKFEKKLKQGSPTPPAIPAFERPPRD